MQAAPQFYIQDLSAITYPLVLYLILELAERNDFHRDRTRSFVNCGLSRLPSRSATQCSGVTSEVRGVRIPSCDTP